MMCTFDWQCESRFLCIGGECFECLTDSDCFFKNHSRPRCCDSNICCFDPESPPPFYLIAIFVIAGIFILVFLISCVATICLRRRTSDNRRSEANISPTATTACYPRQPEFPQVMPQNETPHTYSIPAISYTNSLHRTTVDSGPTSLHFHQYADSPPSYESAVNVTKQLDS